MYICDVIQELLGKGVSLNKRANAVRPSRPARTALAPRVTLTLAWGLSIYLSIDIYRYK